MTGLETSLRLLAEREGQAGKADETTAAIDALAELGAALVRNHIALEQRVTKLEENR